MPAVVGGSDEAHEVFYYSAGVDDLESIQPIPAGLRIIAGDASATPAEPQDTSIVRWHCQSWESNDATNPRFSSTIPECIAPDRVRRDIFFPSCWNYHYAFGVRPDVFDPITQASTGWRLSADSYDVEVINDGLGSNHDHESHN